MTLPDAGASRDPSDPSREPSQDTSRRVATRVPAMIPASALLPDGTVQVCVIRDISTGGARLSIARRHPLAETFRLQIARFDQPFWVRRVWQRGDFAGVMLELGQSAEADPISLSPPGRPPSGAGR